MNVRNDPGSDGSDDFTVRRPVTVADRHLEGLADVLIDCVDGGASVSFMHPLPRAKALEFWRGVADGAAHGQRALLISEDGGGVIGTVLFILHQPENHLDHAPLSIRQWHILSRRR